MKLFQMFLDTQQWQTDGHTNEDDTNTIILRMKIIDGIIMSEGVKYEF